MGAHETEPRTVRAAAVQLGSMPGRIRDNLTRATPFVEAAAEDGAELVVLPELFSCGYLPNRTVWRYAEPLDGPTVRWLRETSRRLRVHLGAGFAELDGTEVYNSFALTGPDGALLGVARKSGAESYVFRRGAGRQVIQTGFGPVGVGICADNHLSELPEVLHRHDVGLVLMPHASPMPYRTSRVVSDADIADIVEKTLAVPRLYADLLGIPVVFVNAIGPMSPMTGLLGRFMTPDSFRLRGFSRLIDLDGTVLGELDEEEGVVTAGLTLDPSRRRFRTPPDHGGWLHPGSTLTRRVVLPFDVAVGRAAYAASRQRRRLAHGESQRRV